MISSTSAAVAGPVFLAHWMSRVGVHSACAGEPGHVLGLRGVLALLALRTWVVTRRPPRKTSTTFAVARTSTCLPTSWYGTL